MTTSRDGILWARDARYEYYLHGPLHRTELGEAQVQGMDYAHTLQGWIKSMNSSMSTPGTTWPGRPARFGQPAVRARCIILLTGLL